MQSKKLPTLTGSSMQVVLASRESREAVTRLQGEQQRLQQVLIQQENRAVGEVNANRELAVIKDDLNSIKHQFSRLKLSVNTAESHQDSNATQPIESLAKSELPFFISNINLI